MGKGRSQYSGIQSMDGQRCGTRKKGSVTLILIWMFSLILSFGSRDIETLRKPAGNLRGSQGISKKSLRFSEILGRLRGGRVGPFGRHPIKKSGENPLQYGRMWSNSATESYTDEIVEESKTPITDSEIMEMLIKKGAQDLYDPYRTSGPGIFGMPPVISEHKSYWEILKSSPYPNGICPENVRRYFTAIASKTFDLTPYEVVLLINHKPWFREQLPELITHVDERLTPSRQEDLLGFINDTLGEVVRNAEINDPHALYNYERREVYQISGVDRHQSPTSNWYDLDECVANDESMSTFRIRVGLSWEAQENCIANNTNSSIPARFIRPKPTHQLLAEVYLECSRQLGHPIDPKTADLYSNDTLFHDEEEKSKFRSKAQHIALDRIGLSSSFGIVPHSHLKEYAEKHKKLRSLLFTLCAQELTKFLTLHLPPGLPPLHQNSQKSPEYFQNAPENIQKSSENLKISQENLQEGLGEPPGNLSRISKALWEILRGSNPGDSERGNPADSEDSRDLNHPETLEAGRAMVLEGKDIDSGEDSPPPAYFESEGLVPPEKLGGYDERIVLRRLLSRGWKPISIMDIWRNHKKGKMTSISNIVAGDPRSDEDYLNTDSCWEDRPDKEQSITDRFDYRQVPPPKGNPQFEIPFLGGEEHADWVG